jgi:crescentin
LTRSLEAARAELAIDAATRRAELTDLQARFNQESAERLELRGDNQRLNDQLAAADRRIAELETDIHIARENLLLSDQEKHAAQASLDQALGEISRTNRHLADAEMSLSAVQNRLKQLEADFSEANNERVQLAATLDEVNERYRADVSALTRRFEALQSRAATTETLLDEARRNLTARAEEIRGYERRLGETASVRNTLEKRLSELEETHAARETELRDLEQSRRALVERTNALTKTVKARETALTRAAEKIVLLGDRVTAVEGELQGCRSSYEQRLEESSAALHREKMERAVAEGALEAGRRDLARLLRDVAALQTRRTAVDDLEAPRPKNDNAPEQVLN